MSSEFTRDEVIDDYIKLNNIDDLFNSDILILPGMKEGAFLLTQPLQMKNEYEDLEIKVYSTSQENLRYYATASYLEFINLGCLVVSTISGLITIANFIKKKYEPKKGTIINICLFNKTKNNTYILHHYEGGVNNFYINELDKMKDDFKKD